jgi:DNA mismatch endonuclease (patch repair protein)
MSWFAQRVNAINMDTLSPKERSERMRRVRGKNTRPELRARSLIHQMGFRFRLHRKDLPGRPDIVLPRYKAAIFVHGCFWHRHDSLNCKLARLPKSRTEFWKTKLNNNKERDRRNNLALRALGWRVFVVWECEFKDTQKLENRLAIFIRGNG